MAMNNFDETGAMGGIEGLAFGVLIFAFGTLLLGNAWAVVDGKMTASAAAREASRNYVEADTSAHAITNAQRAATNAAGRYAVSDITFSSDAPTYRRCAAVTATVRLTVPRVALPLIGGAGGTRPVTATHTEVIDPFRSGIAGSATCN